MRDRYLGRGGPIPADTFKDLSYFEVEASWGGRWISLNDHVNYVIGVETRDTTSVSWRKITAVSPVMEGTYLVHAVRELVTETVNVYVYGQDQFDLAINLAKAEELVSQPDYRIRFTYDDYVETWRCQTADYSVVRSQAFTHSAMAQLQAQVPRFPTVTRERRV